MMKNLDVQTQEYITWADPVAKALQSDDPEQFKKAMASYAEQIQKQVLQEAEGLAGVTDVNVLAARGVRQLTSIEKAYYNTATDVMRSGDISKALTELDVVMPRTIIDNVFEDLERDHPLLDAIDFQYGIGISEWLMNANPDQLATWSPLCAEIVKELTSGFRKIDIAQNKLSAFLPVCKAMLDLGPEWLDRYVRAVLREALALGLENGILNGRGQNVNLHEPIGMRKDLLGSVDPNNGYPDKTPLAVTTLDPVSLGGMIATMAKTENGKDRVVTGLILVVNPTDYWTKVMPATTVRSPDGTYRNDVLPYPIKIIQSSQIAQGEAILGIGSRYLMVSGTGKSGIIDFSDHYRFLEDERIYLTKFYGHGQAKDNNSFLLLDISNLEPLVLDVRVVNAGEFLGGTTTP